MNNVHWHCQQYPWPPYPQTQNLTQLFILHRAHYTPEKLFKWKHRDTAQCHRCKGRPANLIHMLWRFPKLHHYWHEVVSMIINVFRTGLPPGPGRCLLGILDESGIPSDYTVSITRSLLQACKLIAQKWISPFPPTVAEWKTQVRETLIKETYTTQRLSVEI